MRKSLHRYIVLSPSEIHDLSLLLFAIAGFGGLLQAHYQTIGWGDGYEMIRIARNLASNGSFANPFSVMNTGYTAANPPMYPLLLAGIIKLLTRDAFVVFATMLGSTLMNATTAALMPYVSLVLFGEACSGAVASVLWILSMQPILSWDTSYTVAGLLLFTLVTASAVKGQQQIKRRAISAGILGGVLFLLNPSAVMIFLPWLAFLYMRRSRQQSRQVLQYLLVLLLVCSLFPICWGVRNHRRLGAFVVRTNLGMTLYSSNNDCAQSSLIRDELNYCYQSHHPNTSNEEASLLRDLGEVKYDQLRLTDSFAWMRSQPSKFFWLAMARFREFWLPPSDPSSCYQSLAIRWITLLSIPGLLLLFRKREPVLGFILTVLTLYPLVYYVVVTDIRYRYPILWLSLLPAGYLVTELLGAFSRDKREQGAI